MIGLALVTLVGVLAAGLRSRFEGAVNQLFVANYAVTATEQLQPDRGRLGGGDPGSARCDGGLERTRRRRQGVRLAYQRHRRRARRQPGDRHQMEGRKPADAGAARQQRRVRRRCLREGAAPPGRLAAVGRDADRQDAAPDPSRHHLAAQGGSPVRRCDDLDRSLRSGLPEPAEPVHVREHRGWGDIRQHRQAERCPQWLPGRQAPDQGAVQEQPGAGIDVRCSTCSTSCCRCRSSSACSASSTRSC